MGNLCIHSDHPGGIDALISDTAATLQNIYDKRLAGDFTFVGLLSEFARAVERELSKPHEPVAEQLTREEMRGLWDTRPDYSSGIVY